MPKVQTGIEGKYSINGKKLTSPSKTLLIKESFSKPYLKLIDITNQVNRTGSPSYVSGLFKANSTDLSDVYSFDYQDYYYTLKVAENTALITKKNKKGKGQI